VRLDAPGPKAPFQELPGASRGPQPGFGEWGTSLAPLVVVANAR
jgi:hypothetical protein